MSTIRIEIIRLSLNRAWSLIDYNINNNFHKQYEFIQQTILADNSLLSSEKDEAIKINNKNR